VTTADLLSAPQYERPTIQTALGIRFWDSAHDSPVNGNLVLKPVRRPPEFAVFG
jgi:hypothetical protein